MDGIDSASIFEAGPAPSPVSRRLSDKILAAFNHAYASGETKIARFLHRALESHEAKYGPTQDRRSGCSSLGQADLWVRFVEARNHYKGISQQRGMTPAEVATALEAMKDTYKRWCLS